MDHTLHCPQNPVHCQSTSNPTNHQHSQRATSRAVGSKVRHGGDIRSKNSSNGFLASEFRWSQAQMLKPFVCRNVKDVVCDSLSSRKQVQRSRASDHSFRVRCRRGLSSNTFLAVKVASERAPFSATRQPSKKHLPGQPLLFALKLTDDFFLCPACCLLSGSALALSACGLSACPCGRVSVRCARAHAYTQKKRRVCVMRMNITCQNASGSPENM